tara:strand:- start:187 stop:846 length:660 start_codon:yes stop_codon:yes gene_type:complete
MHNSVLNLINIKNNIESNLNNLKINNKTKIIAVSKTFKMEKILPLINFGHLDFGENKVQEAIDKWTETKRVNPKIQLHMIGKLQTNKVKFAVKLFDYIHSVDNEKLIKKIADESVKLNKKIKIFIQVNIGNETQKSGVDLISLKNLILSCKEKNLDLLGLMCIPPINEDPIKYFKEMKKLNNHFNFSELSMGMSSDYLSAAKNSATFLRIGSSIFGERS